MSAWEPVVRKPPVSAPAWEDQLDYAWCRRLFALRAKGRIGIILAESGALYLAESEIDPWGSARRISATGSAGHDRGNRRQGSEGERRMNQTLEQPGLDIGKGAGFEARRP